MWVRRFRDIRPSRCDDLYYRNVPDGILWIPRLPCFKKTEGAPPQPSPVGEGVQVPCDQLPRRGTHFIEMCRKEILWNPCHPCLKISLMWPLPGSRLLEGPCGTPIFPLSLMHFHHFLAPYPPKIIIFAKPASPNNRHLGPFSLLDLRLARSV